MLGGTGVVVSGTQLFIREDDDIQCIFDGTEVRGIYLDEQNILCVSPLLSQTGRLPFQITINGSISFTGESIFTSCKCKNYQLLSRWFQVLIAEPYPHVCIHAVSFTRAYEVYIPNSDLVLSSDTMVRVQWSPESILPMEASDNYRVDIELLEMNTDSGSWNKIATLKRDLPNNGSADIRIPDIPEEDTVESSISPVIIRVSLNVNSARKRRGIFSNVLEKLGRFALKTIRNSPMRFLKKLIRQAAQRALCELWCVFQPANIGEEILNRLPPCPRRVRDARASNSGFDEERVSSHIPIIGKNSRLFWYCSCR